MTTVTLKIEVSPAVRQLASALQNVPAGDSLLAEKIHGAFRVVQFEMNAVAASGARNRVATLELTDGGLELLSAALALNVDNSFHGPSPAGGLAPTSVPGTGHPPEDKSAAILGHIKALIRGAVAAQGAK